MSWPLSWSANAFGSLSGDNHARGQHRWVDVADDQDIGVFGDVEFGDSADLYHIVPGHLAGHRR